MKRLSVFVFILISISVQTLYASVDMYGTTFDDNAFADNVSYVSGDVAYWGFSKWGY